MHQGYINKLTIFSCSEDARRIGHVHNFCQIYADGIVSIISHDYHQFILKDFLYVSDNEKVHHLRILIHKKNNIDYNIPVYTYLSVIYQLYGPMKPQTHENNKMLDPD